MLQRNIASKRSETMKKQKSSSEDLVETLWRNCSGVVRATQSLPVVYRFVQGRPTIDEYRYFLLQDYLYLDDYGKALELAALKATEYSIKCELRQSSRIALEEEKAFIFNEAIRMGCGKDEIQKGRRMPATQAYGDFLIRTASQESLGEIIAVFLVCNKSFHEIGKLNADRQTDRQTFFRWRGRYTSNEVNDAVDRYKKIFLLVCDDSPPHLIDRFAVAFETAVYYEYKFWSAVEYREDWLKV